MPIRTNRITLVFDRLRSQKRKALIPYIMAGDPSLSVTEKLVLELERSGADLIELGVPFSDPIADGPVIQQAAERALQSGTSLKNILALVKSLRHTTQIPIILMAYYNTLMAMGEDRFCRAAVASGIDGVIVPDMPPEESAPLYHAALTHGLHVIFLLAPTSTSARKTLVTKRSHGFIYYVSLTGITGSPMGDISAIQQQVRHLQRTSSMPIAVGFGIATPQQAQRIAQFADGVIVGSALVKQIEKGGPSSRVVSHIGAFTKSLRQAMDNVSG